MSPKVILFFIRFFYKGPENTFTVVLKFRLRHYLQISLYKHTQSYNSNIDV